MNFIGQNKLIDKLNNLTLDNMPKSLILCGDSGCGKNTYLGMISSKLGFDIVDISDSISLDTISRIEQTVEPHIYKILSDDLTEREQNVILKFLEEPLNNSYIVLLSTNTSKLLNTIQNRCQVWKFENYNHDDLTKFIPNESTDEQREFILSIATTPGQVMSICNNEKLSNIVNFSMSFINNIHKASFGNALNITDKLSCKMSDNNKIDIKIFFTIVLNKLHEIIMQPVSSYYYKFYIATSKLLSDINNIPTLDKSHRIDNYLFEVKRLKYED